MYWLNGELIDRHPVVSAYDSGLMYGDIAFEMTRSFNGKHFKLREHLHRLFDSMELLEIPTSYTVVQLELACRELTIELLAMGAINPDDEIRLMINCSRGPLPAYANIIKPEPWTMITAFPLKYVVKGFSQLYGRGVHARIPSQRQIPAQYLDPRAKTRSRLHLRIAERQAAPAWPLLLDDNGYITESSGANFFIVKDDRVCTPRPLNILNGISRRYVMDMVKSGGKAVIEMDMLPFDVITSDEAFFTATPFCILPCTSIDGHQIANGRPGFTTYKLINIWSDSVDCDFVKQMEEWDVNHA